MALEDAAELAAFVQVAVLLRAGGCVALAGCKSSVCADGCVIVCSRLCSFTCRYNSCVSIQVKPTICWLYNEGELVPFFKGK